MEAEREIVQLKKLQFMRDKVGEELTGVISSVSSYGFYVELSDFFVEGMVHISALEDDFYQFIEEHFALIGKRSLHVFRIGDRVRVKVIDVNMSRRQLYFALMDHEPLVSSAPLRQFAHEEYTRMPIRGKKPVGWRSGARSPSPGGRESASGKATGGRKGGGKRTEGGRGKRPRR